MSTSADVARHGRRREHTPSGVVTPVKLALRCRCCRESFVLTGQRAWLALRAKTEGLGAICDPCAARVEADRE